jgi:hypothetical protein
VSVGIFEPTLVETAGRSMCDPRSETVLACMALASIAVECIDVGSSANASSSSGPPSIGGTDGATTALGSSSRGTIDSGRTEIEGCD